MEKVDNQCDVLKMIVCFEGVGEIGVVGSIPAIANAILDALWERGVRTFDMPAYPQKIWKLLQKQSRETI